MSQDMQTCITPVDMLHKDSMQPHGRKGFDRYAGAVACVDSYAGAMSGLGESRSDSADGHLRVWLNISASVPAAALISASSVEGNGAIPGHFPPTHIPPTLKDSAHSQRILKESFPKFTLISIQGTIPRIRYADQVGPTFEVHLILRGIRPSRLRPKYFDGSSSTCVYIRHVCTHAGHKLKVTQSGGF